MKPILTLLFVIVIVCSSYAQDIKREHKGENHAYSYAYITVEGRSFGKKLKVNVDLGDTPEQIKSGEEYSEILTNKKSYAAVLNYMAERQFELVESRDISFSFQGTGGSSGIVLIMRKKQNDR